MSFNPDGRPSLRAYLATGVTIVLAAAALTTVVDKTWFQDKLKRANLDSLFLLSPPRPSPDVVLVEIKQCDYRELFNSSSPLEPRVVRQLIQAIGDAGARVIGVDLLTGHWDSADFQGLNPPKLVWALDAEETGKGTWRLERIERGRGQAFGPPALEVVDGQVRQYWREPRVEPPGDDGRGYVESFTNQLLRYASKGHVEPSAKPGESETIDFVARPSHFRVIKAGDVLLGAKSPRWKEEKIMDDKVVLLGGAFREARDQNQTPLGTMYNVEVLANIVSSEMGSPRLHEAGDKETLIVDFLFGLAIVWVSYYQSRPWSVITVPLGAIIVAVGISGVLFSVWRHYLSFMPILVGIVIHAGVEHFHEYRNVLLELKELKSVSGHSKPATFRK